MKKTYKFLIPNPQYYSPKPYITDKDQHDFARKIYSLYEYNNSYIWSHEKGGFRGYRELSKERLEKELKHMYTIKTVTINSGEE